MAVGKINRQRFEGYFNELNAMTLIDIKMVERGFSDGLNKLDIEVLKNEDRKKIMAAFQVKMDKKYVYYKPFNVNNLKQAAITIHLNYLHRVQLDMIDEAVEKSDMKESREVIKHIMELKSEKKHSS